VTAANDERRPARGGVTVEKSHVNDTITLPLDRRRQAALRLAALDHRLGDDLTRRDPLSATYVRSPQTWGMSPSESVAHARRLRSSGWSPWEIRAVLVVPS
jgi:hypothetical protein